MQHLISAVAHPEAQTRWGALYALSFIAARHPESLDGSTNKVLEQLSEPKSMIVRERALIALGNY